MSSIYSSSSDSSEALSISERDVDDESVLLSNANRLLSAVGIVSKQIMSAKELARVASSMFVAVLESLFHTRIDGINRNPQRKIHYEENAQLVINYLSERIEMDLKHISGNSVAAGDLIAISNLVHILVRIISITSQEEDCSSIETSSDFNQDIFDRELPSMHSIQFDEEFQRAGAANDTHTSTLTGSNQARSSLRQSSNGNKLIDEALKKTDAYLNFEKKMDLAKKRRERLHALKSADSRTANNRRDNCSRRSLQKKWIEDRTREKKSFLLRRSTEDHVVMRKIYKTALQKLMTWQLEDAREIKRGKQVTDEHLKLELSALEHLFKDRVDILRTDASEVNSGSLLSIRSERASYKDISRTVQQNLQKITESEVNQLQHKREMELVRRQESHKALLGLLSASSWQDSLRTPDYRHTQLSGNKSSRQQRGHRSSSAHPKVRIGGR